MSSVSSTVRKFLVPAVLVGAVLLFGLALAGQDAFKFMPKGGRDLFVEVLGRCVNCDDIVTMVTTRKTQDEWLKYFTGRQSSLKSAPEERKKGALAGLAEKQMTTLVSYLAINTPVPKENLPKDAKKIDWISVLPLDGRQLTLEKCMGCHSIAVTVLNTADVRGWAMILRKSDHAVIRLTDKETETLKSYLAITMPVPEDDVPEQLRKSAGAY